MAKRIVYTKTKEAPFYNTFEVDFVWAQGLNKVCRRRSIANLLNETGRLYPHLKVLDVSYVSDQEMGVKLSSVNLPITLASGKPIPVECAYQGSRLINHAGPYEELLDADAIKAKEHPRMSGENTGFLIDDKEYAADVLPSFYDWLYCRALNQNPELAIALEKFDAYCSIMSPVGSIKCEARAAAIYEGLRMSGQLSECLDDFDIFCRTMKGDEMNKMTNESRNAIQIISDESNELFDTAADVKADATVGSAESPSISEPDAHKAPTVETITNILSMPALTKFLANTGAALGISGSSRERADMAARHLVSCYQQVLRDEQITQDGESLIFSAGPVVTVKLTPNEKLMGGWHVFIQINQESAAPHAVQNETEGRLESSSLKKELTPAIYAEEHGFNVISMGTQEPALIVRLAHKMQEVCKSEAGSGFFQRLRKNIHVTGSSYYKLADTIDKDEKNDLITMLYEMKKLGLLREAFCNQKTNCITYILPAVEKIKQFLMGGWLECAFFDDVKRIVSEYAKTYGLPAHVVGNLKLGQNSDNPGSATHELDVAFTLGDIFFACEAKTGAQVDYDRFRIVGKDLDILPDRLLLINSSLSSEEAEAVNWWYPYHVAAGADMESALRSMISDVLEKAGCKSAGITALPQRKAA